MHYAKIIEIKGMKEYWLDMFGRMHDNPVPLTTIELAWAVKAYFEKYVKEYQLVVSTGSTS